MSVCGTSMREKRFQSRMNTCDNDEGKRLIKSKRERESLKLKTLPLNLQQAGSVASLNTLFHNSQRTIYTYMYIYLWPVLCLIVWCSLCPFPTPFYISIGRAKQVLPSVLGREACVGSWITSLNSIEENFASVFIWCSKMVYIYIYVYNVFGLKLPSYVKFIGFEETMSNENLQMLLANLSTSLFILLWHGLFYE